jgi:Spy/CpxP family protein refolding chaperone
MKKMLLSSAIVFAFLCAAHAQEKNSQQVTKENDQKSYQAKQAQEWDNYVKSELKLTDEQATKLAAINKDFAEKKEALLKDASLSDEARKEKKWALKKDKEEKMAAVLTPEQQTKYKQLMYKKMQEPPKKEV